MTIWRMRLAGLMIKVRHKHTHSEYAVLTALARQQWLHERVSMLRYTNIVCLVNCNSLLRGYVV
jgi:hypothetical protein